MDESGQRSERRDKTAGDGSKEVKAKCVQVDEGGGG